MPKVDYLTKKGYIATVQLGGLGHDHDAWMPFTNDPEAYSLLDHQWVTQEIAQERLDKVAKDNNWERSNAR